MITALVLQPLLPMSIIYLPLLIVLQDLIGIIDIVKLGHRIRVVRIFIGMVLDCEFSIGFLDFTGGGCLTDTQYLVEITSD